MKETTSNKPIYLAELPSNIDDISRYILEQDSINALSSILKYPFTSNLLVRALTHTSAVHEFPDLGLRSNEKLEFLGDAVLGLMVTDLIWEAYPELPEGDLSKLRGALVNKSSLAEIAKRISLGSCLILGRGEIKARGHEKESILADAFEAVIGALYLDGGYDKTFQSFKTLLNYLKENWGEDFLHITKLYQFDAKSRLQELTMKAYKEFPVYKSTETEDEFLIEIYLKGKSLAQTISKSKKDGEHELARRVLAEKLWERKSC